MIVNNAIYVDGRREKEPASLEDDPVIVNNAIYVDGRREKEPASLEDTYETSREKGGFAWIGLYEPTEEEFETVAGEFDLHELAVEDAIRAHQRPKIERYGDSVFVVLKSARYRDGSGSHHVVSKQSRL